MKKSKKNKRQGTLRQKEKAREIKDKRIANTELMRERERERGKQTNRERKNDKVYRTKNLRQDELFRRWKMEEDGESRTEKERMTGTKDERKKGRMRK